MSQKSALWRLSREARLSHFHRVDGWRSQQTLGKYQYWSQPAWAGMLNSILIRTAERPVLMRFRCILCILYISYVQRPTSRLFWSQLELGPLRMAWRPSPSSTVFAGTVRQLRFLFEWIEWIPCVLWSVCCFFDFDYNLIFPVILL